MKKFQFLLLDTGPIIKLFELGIWEDFIRRCDVAVSQTVADQAKWASQEFEDIRIDLESYKDRINIFDIDPSLAKSFLDRFDEIYKTEIHDGEKETLAFLYQSSQEWIACSSDHVVFKILGRLGKADQGISLQEILQKIGLCPSQLEFWYTKEFCEKWTHKGQEDFIQNKGLL